MPVITRGGSHLLFISLHSFSALFSIYIHEMIVHNGVCLLTQQQNHFNKHIRQTANGHKWYKKLFVYHFSNKSPSMTIHTKKPLHTQHTRKQKLAFLVWMFKFTALLISMFFHIHPGTCFSKRPVMIFFPPLYWISARESFIRFWPFTFNFGMLCF